MLGQLINWAHPLARGLVGCWIFNEGSGDKVYDLSLNGNHGTLTNMIPESDWIPGRNGWALDFDGTDDNVDTTYITHHTKISFTAWVYVRGWGGNNLGRIIDKRASGGTQVFLLFVSSTNAKLNFDRNFSTTLGEWVTPTNSIALGNWYHVALTYDDSSVSNDPKIYINGISQVLTESSTPVGTANTNTDSYIIGNRGDGLRGFDGYIEEVRLYNRILTDLEVMQLYINPYAMWKDDLFPAIYGGLVVAAGSKVGPLALTGVGI